MKNNFVNFYYKQPKYMDKFYCIGGECPETCCAKWLINWEQSEIEKVLNNCSDELREKLKVSFMLQDATEKMYAIKLNEKKMCPLLTEDGLCSIQKELGEEYLSYVCRLYPRMRTQFKNYIYNVCTISCYKVADMLCNDDHALDMTIKKVNESVVKCRQFTEDKIKKNPEIVYLGEIVDFFMDILSDKTRSIDTSIVIGALVAKKLSQLIEDGKTDSIPTILKKLKPQTEDKKQIESIDNIKPNYNFSIGVVNEIIGKCFGREIMEHMYTDGIPHVDKFLKGREKFERAFEGSMAERNMILNIFLELFTHKYKPALTLFEEYLYFAFTASAIKLAGAAVGYATDNVQKEYRHYISLYIRKLDSNEETIVDVINILKEHKIDTPAYIALMMKY